MRNEAGFTLVETVVTGVISAVLAGSVLSMLYLVNAQVKESLAMARLSMHYDVVSEAFHRAAREATTVAGNSETPPLTLLSTPFTGLGSMRFYSEDNITGGFWIGNDGILKEWKDGAFRTFMIGADSVYSPDFHFAIQTNRASISFRMNLSLTEGGKTYVLTNPREYVKCRNNLD